MTLRRPFVTSVAACALLGVLGFSSLAGCTGSKQSEREQAPAATSGGMGMGGGAKGGVPLGSRVIAASRNASIEMAEDGASSAFSGSITVARVVAPADGWLVVRSATPPGGILGSTSVARGESRDVAIKLANPDSPQVRVALHVDRGAKGAFEFDPTGVRRRPDSPVYASGKPVERDVTVAAFGIAAITNAALIKAESQRVSGGVLRVRLPSAARTVVGRGQSSGR